MGRLKSLKILVLCNLIFKLTCYFLNELVQIFDKEGLVGPDIQTHDKAVVIKVV